MKIYKKYVVGIATFAAVVTALLFVSVAAQPSLQAECSFDGIWSTS